MKLLLHTTLCLLIACIFQTSTQAQGIEFFQGSFEQAVQKAKEEGKCIFLDAYTDWCVPCQRMDKNVFTHPKIAGFHNEEFINVKMNMDAPASKAMADQYGIKYYPTFLYFDQHGNGTHKISGECDVESFLQHGKDALNDDRQFFTLLDKYEKGQASEDQLYYLARAMPQTGTFQYEKMTAISNAYLKKQTEMTSPKNMDFIMLTACEQESMAFQSMVDNKDLYLSVFGDNKFISKVQEVTQFSVNLAATLKDEKMLEEVLAFNQNNVPMFAGWINARLRVSYYEQTDQWDQYATAAIPFVDNFARRDADIMNHVAWNFYENVDNKDHLTKALNWTEKAISMNPDYFFYDTKAALQYKLGDRDKALKTCQEAIKLAEKYGEEPKLTMELMRKFSN